MQVFIIDNSTKEVFKSFSKETSIFGLSLLNELNKKDVLFMKDSKEYKLSKTGIVYGDVGKQWVRLNKLVNTTCESSKAWMNYVVIYCSIKEK